MSDQLHHTESLQPQHELVNSLVQEMGEQPQQRLDWLMQQTGESFGNILIQLNSAARELDKQEHTFDGEGVVAGSVGGSVPPNQEDKIILIDELISTTQQRISAGLKKGEDPQAIVNELAVAIPTIVNKLHLFADGNGRTSRILRMLLRDGDQITPEKVEAAVQKKGKEKYDTTPVPAVETSVLRYMRSINGTSEINISRDLVDGEYIWQEEIDKIRKKFPNISPSVLRAYGDGDNFMDAVGLLAIEKGIYSVSLSDLFAQIADSPEELAKFTAAYRSVRKQKVELLIGALMSEVAIPLNAPDKERAIHKYINQPRTGQGLAPIDPALIDTAQKFQYEYCEAFSPKRTVALSRAPLPKNSTTTPK
jgi:hypothetical protein